MRGFSDLKTAGDLRGKLGRDLARLKAEPLNSDAAFNFFVTAERLVDWAHPADAGRPERTELGEIALLGLCSHLANGAKHFEATRRGHKSVSSTTGFGFESPGFGPFGFGPFGFEPPGLGPFGFEPVGSVLTVALEGEAAAEFGPSIGAIALAERVMEYWAAQDLPR